MVSLLIFTVGIPAILYLLLWISPVRHAIRDVACSELSALLGVEVEIGEVEIEPFTRLNIDGVSVRDSLGRTLAEVQRISGGINPMRLLATRRLLVNDVEIIGPTFHMWRDSASAPLNIAPIIARLKSDNRDNEKKRFSLALHTAVVRQGSFTYDVLDAPQPEPGRFDPRHVALSDLKADVALPRISDRGMTIRLKRLQAREQSGLQLRDLRGSLMMNDTLLTLSDLSVELPVTRLSFSDLRLSYPEPDSLVAMALRTPHVLSIEKGSRIYPPDFAALHPGLAKLNVPIAIEATVTGTPRLLHLQKFTLRADDVSHGSLLSRGRVASVLSPDSLAGDLEALNLTMPGADLLTVVDAFTAAPAPTALSRALLAMGRISLTASGGYAAGKAHAAGRLESEAGALNFDAEAALGIRKSVKAEVTGEALQLGALLGNNKLGSADFHATAAGSTGNGVQSGEASLRVSRLGFNGHDYPEITADATLHQHHLEATAEVVDELLGVYIEGSAELPSRDNQLPDVKLSMLVDHADFDAMGLWRKYPGYSLTAQIDADLTDVSAQNTTGRLIVDDFSFANREEGKAVNLGPITLTARKDETGATLAQLKSDVVEARFDGRYDFAALSADIESIMRGTRDIDDAEPRNDFKVTGRVLPNDEFFDFMHLPVKPMEVVKIGFGVNNSLAWASVDAPYLALGKKLLKVTLINANLGARSDMLLRTRLKTNDGYAAIESTVTVDSLREGNLNLGWAIDRLRRFDGSLALAASVMSDPDNGKPAGARIDIRRSQAVINDSIWEIMPAAIDIAGNRIAVDHLHIGRNNQSIDIAGVAAPDSASRLDVGLKNIDLDYIFETLSLGDNLMFGGRATGDVSGHALLSPAPILRTDNLLVKDFSYNGGVFGNADITALWDNERKGIVLRADVAQPNGHSTAVDGLIVPSSPGVLDFTFTADRTPVAFMRRLLAAFASDVTGEASGQLRLYGTFKKVNLAGGVKPHDFGLTVAATNCTYYSNDSVRFTPGVISLDGMTVRDPKGNTARLDGKLRHDYLKDATFDFRVHDARHMLVYDTRPSDTENWFGRIFGTGSARITGRPGVVNVEANISTDPNSEFTFTLSDREQAGEYSFLAFRDRDYRNYINRTLEPGSPELDRIMEERLRTSTEQAAPTTFGMDLKLTINPSAKINLIMDPVSGDKITAYGAGTPNVIYSSANDDFKIFGDYTIERGDYHFTLQDIIIKNFTIEEGSKVYFRGDLDHISLDINALYALKANLSDLDESFLNDKEVGRTSVTVQAVLQVDGAINSPNIEFDLRFPTLTSDVDRKVHAIVSTKEMMNRQIIYLLALNRFYTPDYMTATSGNRGSELVSVASSTISSQLSNILGQISDKFTLAPNLRSDAGDFSDVEFDLALSSTLLNNRLLLNGNFGYRDQMLNNNQFVGDFDIEYLLNRGGNWRLKAYNHFNDRNLYVKTAMTTQGLGLVFKHDFDSLKRFFRRKKAADNQAK